MIKLRDFSYQQGEDPKPRKTHQTWYRGEHCGFIPSKPNLREANAIDRYVLAGWLPDKPFIRKDMCISAFGSCFAQHISRFLENHGYLTGASILAEESEDRDFQDSHVVEFGEGIVNTFALLQQFEWAYENKRFSENLWYGSNAQLADYDDQIRDRTRRMFEKTDVFILTLGLSEVWYNKMTGEAFWRAIPRERFDPKLHGFKVATFQENFDNLQRLYAILRRHKPDASLIITLSPIPLVATFRPVSCITADCVSKALLRAALDEFLRGNSHDANLHYWPSYELLTRYFSDPYLEDNRHVKPQVLEVVMSKFAEHYLVDPVAKTNASPLKKNSQKARDAVRRIVRWLGRVSPNGPSGSPRPAPGCGAETTRILPSQRG